MKKQLLINWVFEYGDSDYATKVPGDITDDLYKHGIISDPFFSDNYKSINWIHERDWVYKSRFLIEADDMAYPDARLTFKGVDTFSKVYVNGFPVGETESMFYRYDFDIKPYIHEGENEVRVVLLSVREKLRSFDNKKYLACFDNNRIFIRKAQCHFGWDWAPDFPGTGIFDDVEIAFFGGNKIEFVKAESQNDGKVKFFIELMKNGRKASEEIEIKIFDEEGKEVACDRTGATGITNILNLYVENPKLWYPNGYGKQYLYSYKAGLYRQETLLWEEGGRFAFRTIRIEEPVLGKTELGFKIYVNGMPIKAVGSNWVPASILTGCITDERYEKLILYAKEGGINMLRIWGGGLYEKDIFYDLCDKYGILIWQDFMFSCCNIPDDIKPFRDIIEKECVFQIKRLRNHPCIAIWCGGNELTNAFRFDNIDYGRYIVDVMLPGLCYTLDGTRKYILSSPYSRTDVGNDASSGDCHINALAPATAKDDIFNFRKYQWENDTTFVSECAVLGMCRYRSFIKFMPQDKIWPQNELWEDRLSFNPYDLECSRSFTNRINKNVEAMFGGYSDIFDYIKKSMVVHSEVMRAEIEFFRSNPNCFGFLNWMYNDIWGNATWAIVDYYLEKKPAYYAMKRAGRRRCLAIVYRREGYSVNVFNDTGEPLSGKLNLYHRGLDGARHGEWSFDIALRPFEQARIPIVFDQGIKNSYLYAEMGDHDVIYFYDLWKDKSFETDLDVEYFMLDDEGCNWRVDIAPKRFARVVFIDLPQDAWADFSDNYFDLVEGKKKSVYVRTERPVKREDFAVRTFADAWTE